VIVVILISILVRLMYVRDEANMALATFHSLPVRALANLKLWLRNVLQTLLSARDEAIRSRVCQGHLYMHFEFEAFEIYAVLFFPHVDPTDIS
jgi:hypothetical protein